MWTAFYCLFCKSLLQHEMAFTRLYSTLSVAPPVVYWWTIDYRALELCKTYLENRPQHACPSPLPLGKEGSAAWNKSRGGEYKGVDLHWLSARKLSIISLVRLIIAGAGGRIWGSACYINLWALAKTNALTLVCAPARMIMLNLNIWKACNWQHWVADQAHDIRMHLTWTWPDISSADFTSIHGPGQSPPLAPRKLWVGLSIDLG